VVPGQLGVQPERNSGDQHCHNQTPDHDLSIQARKKIHHKEAHLQGHPPPHPWPTQGSQDIRSTRTPTSHTVQSLVTSGQHPHFPRDPRTRRASQTTQVRTRPTTQTSAGNHIPTTPYSNRSRLPSRFLNQQPPHPTNSIRPLPSKPASHLHPALSTPQTHSSVSQNRQGHRASTARQHTTPHLTSQHNKHQNTHKDGILLSPRSTSAISARYRGFRDHGNGFRHPEPQEETQRSGTTTKNQPTRRQARAPVPNPDRISLSPRSTSAISPRCRVFRDPGNSFRHPEPQEETQRSGTTGTNPGIRNHHKEPVIEEPIRRQIRAPVPNPDRISLSPRSTSAIPARYRRFQYHGNSFRHP
jgi:hypothetical protein